ncbi:MAG: hypothetical protein H6560_00005 [Lewinellaceae bacterium]|nr:hypothetical protein [Lewinellaceae bacterium]
MKMLHKFSALSLLLVLLLAACNKENLDEIKPEDPNYEPTAIIVNNLLTSGRTSSTSEGVEMACLSINYPFDMVLESNEAITINSQSDFQAAVAPNTSNPVVDFAFPLTVVDAKGNTKIVNDNNALGRDFASCIPETGWAASASNGETVPACLVGAPFCFEYVYPANLADEDGNTYTAGNEGEFIDLFATIPSLSLQLPASFLDEEGNTIVVNDFDAFFNLTFECEDITPPVTGEGIEIQGFGCLELVYPFNVVDSDGTAITVNDEDEYANLILNGAEVELQYPFSLTNAEGDTFVIEEIFDVIEALETCGVIIDINTDTLSCGDTQAHVLLFFNGLNILTLNNYEYDINFPVSLIVEGNQVVVNNEDEYLPAVGGSPFNVKQAEIVYPVTVTQFGRQIVLNNDDEVCQFYQTLDEPCENKPAHIQFFYNEGPGTPINCAYFIEYPVEIVLNGATIQVQSRDDYVTELNTPGAYDEIELVYPVSAIKYSSGQQIIFGSDDDICEFLDNCQ